jgi:hypothetical protein
MKYWRSDATKYQIPGITTVDIERNEWVLSAASALVTEMWTLRCKRQFFAECLFYYQWLCDRAFK